MRMESFAWQHITLSVIACSLIFTANAYTPAFYAIALLSILLAFVFADIKKQVPTLNSPEKIFVGSFLIYTAYGAINMLLQGYWEWSTFNYPVKFALVLGLYFTIRKYGYSNKALTYAAFSGVLASFIWATYQSEVLNIARVYGSTNKFVSAFGLIALLSGFMSIAYLVLNAPLSLIKATSISLISLMTLYSILSTGTKGVWITIPALIALLFLSTEQISIKKLLSLGLILILLPPALYLTSKTFEHRINEILEPIAIYITTGIPTDGSATIRLETWKATLIMFLENPIFGVGVDNFKHAKKHLIEIGNIHPYASYPSGPHNDFIGGLGTKGILGFIATLMVYISLALLLWRQRHASKFTFSAGTALILIMSISGLTGDRLEANLTVTFYAIMAASLAGQSSFNHQKSTIRQTQ